MSTPAPLIIATSSRPPPPSSASSSASTSCAATIDPTNGSILPSLRTGAGIGLRSLSRYPMNNKFGGGGGGGGLDVYYGHGTGSGDAGSGSRSRSSKDENIYLIAAARHGGSAAAAGAAGDKASSGMGQRWRTKPPEPITSNVCVSPCGTFVLAGTKSGRCYVWNILGTSHASSSGGGSGGGSGTGGDLLRIWTAHNRPVTRLTFSSDGAVVITAGQDGIVNAFSLLDVASSKGASNDNDDGGGPKSVPGVGDTIRPVRTFSEHHLPVQSLAALPSNRLVSVSPDRQVILMELCSGSTLARILLPTSIKCVSADDTGRRIYAGGDDGVVYCIDLDVVAVKETAESATIVAIAGNNTSRSAELSLSGSKLGESILGMTSSSRPTDQVVGGVASSGGSSGGVSELRGHSRPVTALAVIDGDQLHPLATAGARGMLVSGSDDGTLRIWDLRTRACARVVRPWGGGSSGASSSSTASSSTAASSSSCPISSILIVPRETGRGSFAASGPFGLGAPTHTRGRGARTADGFLDLFRPLQRFPSDRPSGDIVPILKSTRNVSLVRRWEGRDEEGTVGKHRNQSYGTSKRPRLSNNEGIKEGTKTDSADDEEGDGFLAMDSTAADNEDDDEKSALRKELEEARATIKRWEKVNNKLASKLQKATAAQG